MTDANADHISRLTLFVAGREPNSALARRNLEQFVEEYCGGAQYGTESDLDIKSENEDEDELTFNIEIEIEIEVVDVFEDYQRALTDNIFVTPALILERRVRPGAASETVRIFGNLSDTGRLLDVLGLPHHRGSGRGGAERGERGA